MSADNDSVCVGHEPCPECGSSDNLARYSDNHGYCFGCTYYEPGDGTEGASAQPRTPVSGIPLLMDGEVVELRKRRIDYETCRKFNYSKNTHKGRPVQVAPYYDAETGQLCAQKLRYPDKDFVITGDIKRAGLFGQQLWQGGGGKMVIVTEGEIDALTVSQLQGNKWPVVSIPGGAPSARKALAKSMEWLLKYESIVLMFDNDEAGNAAAEECAPLFPAKRCKIAKMPLKDANEMLVAGRGEEIMRAAWNAQPYRPSGIVTMTDIMEDALTPTARGLDWPWPTLTRLTYGRRRGEVYALGAGTGNGKTDVWTQTAMHTVMVDDLPVGMFYLEQPPKETANRLVGKFKSKRFHVPDAGWTEDERVDALRELEATGKVYFFNHWGCADWDEIKQRIRWLVVSEGVKDIFLDHLTALATGEGKNEKEELETIMGEIGSMTQELDFTLYLISHLATPEGTPHEEGGRVSIRHFKGSRAIGFWCYFMFGMERDQQHEDVDTRHTTTFRILKDRLTGQGTGEFFYLGYDAETGMLYEREAPTGEGAAAKHGFTDESGEGPVKDDF